MCIIAILGMEKLYCISVYLYSNRCISSSICLYIPLCFELCGMQQHPKCVKHQILWSAYTNIQAYALRLLVLDLGVSGPGRSRRSRTSDFWNHVLLHFFNPASARLRSWETDLILSGTKLSKVLRIKPVPCALKMG